MNKHQRGINKKAKYTATDINKHCTFFDDEFTSFRKARKFVRQILHIKMKSRK